MAGGLAAAVIATGALAAAAAWATATAAPGLVPAIRRLAAGRRHFGGGLSHDAERGVPPAIFRRDGLAGDALDIAHQRTLIVGA